MPCLAPGVRGDRARRNLAKKGAVTGMLENLFVLPIPLVLILVLGLVLWVMRGLSLALMAAATLALLAFSLPLIGGALERPLANGAAPYQAGATPAPAAILVPTGGIYADMTGVYWASSSSIRRAVAGKRLQQQTGLPLVVIGGAPNGESQAEAAVVARQVGLGGPSVILETGATNTAETAEAAALILGQLEGNAVILVTSPNHVARMAGALRHAGIWVTMAPIAAESSEAPAKAGAPGTVDDDLLTLIIPSADGFAHSSAALREYGAIVWYLFQGHLRLADVLGGW